jgi:hypothetical protein
MRRRFVGVASAALSAVGFLVSSSGAVAPLNADDSLPARVKEVLRKRCYECHNPEEANGGVRVLDHATLLAKEKLLPGKPDESLLYQRIMATDDSVMPPEGQARLPSEEIDLIRRWIVAGAPVFPPDAAIPDAAATDAALQNVVGAEYVFQSILAHLRTLPMVERRFVRYFSTNHLLTSGATEDELKLHRDALSKALNHLTWQRQIVVPTAIEPTGTIFAVDLRKLGWDQQPFESIVAGESKGKSKLNLFDLVLLDYPYAVVYEDSDTYNELAETYLIPSGMVRPVPYVRADWFASVATQPLLYEDLLQLPMELAELEQRLGVDAQANVDNGTARRAGMTVSGVSRNNRVVERHRAALGCYWKSFDYATNKGHENMFQDPVALRPVGGEMVFSLPNGLHGYLVTDHVGRRIEVAPTNIVTDKFAEDKTVRNGLSCMRCHEFGIKDFADTVRPAVEQLPGSPGFDKRHTLQLYAPQKEMDELIREDTDRFMAAMAQALGGPQTREPLAPVTQRFLDGPISLTRVGAELGLKSTEGLQHIFRSPQFGSLGLIPLISHGVIRRDMWEDYFDQVVRGLGIGVPVVPIDGLARGDYPATTPAFKIGLSTNRSNNVFAPGDQMAVFITNRSNTELHIELIGTSASGRKVVLVPSSTVLAPGQQFRFPEEGTIKIESGVGKEFLTVFASDAEFPAGEVLRAKDVFDRVVHRFYTLEQSNGRIRVGFDPSRLIKRTIEIETR